MNSRTSREEILAAVRSVRPPECQLPSLDNDWIVYPDRVKQFSNVLQSIGGECFQVSNAIAAMDKLLQLPPYQNAKQRISLVPGVGKSNIDISLITDPHTLESVDFAILPGNFGIAENGAIWVTGRNLCLPALFFIVQHLALVVSSREIVDNMHQAYERLAFDGPGYGSFIAGPSKTADIEQSLVIGAHGPRSLTVFCMG